MADHTIAYSIYNPAYTATLDVENNSVMLKGSTGCVAVKIAWTHFLNNALYTDLPDWFSYDMDTEVLSIETDSVEYVGSH